MVVNVYAQRFQDYSGQGFQVLDSRFDGEKDTLVLSKIVPESGPEISVDWRVRYKKSGYKVIDVIVEGVSMSVSHRSDFSAVIQRGGGRVDSLIKHLEKQASL